MLDVWPENIFSKSIDIFNFDNTLSYCAETFIWYNIICSFLLWTQIPKDITQVSVVEFIIYDNTMCSFSHFCLVGHFLYFIACFTSYYTLFTSQFKILLYDNYPQFLHLFDVLNYYPLNIFIKIIVFFSFYLYICSNEYVLCVAFITAMIWIGAPWIKETSF